MTRGTERTKEVGKQRQPVVSQKWVSQSMSQSRSVAHLARVERCGKWAGSSSLLAADLTFTLVASCLAAFAHLIPPPPCGLPFLNLCRRRRNDAVCLSLSSVCRLLQLVCAATTLTPFYLHIKQHRWPMTRRAATCRSCINSYLISLPIFMSLSKVSPRGQYFIIRAAIDINAIPKAPPIGIYISIMFILVFL